MDTAPRSPQKILIIDDETAARETLAALLLPLGHEVIQASSGKAGIIACRNEQPDLVILDVMMPEMDGFSVCRALRADEETADIPIVMLTALQDRKSKLEGIDAGADDFLSKPVDRVELRVRVRATLRLKRTQRKLEQRQRLTETMTGTLEILRDILSMVDPDAFGQAKRLQSMAEDLGRAVGYEAISELTMAALLCQVGRVTIPDELRARAAHTHRMNFKERNLLMSVPEIGANLIGRVPMFTGVAEIVRYQNKNMDGTGVPRDSLETEQPPHGARILTIVQDILAGQIGGLNRSAAVQRLREMPGRHDPDILAVAVELFGQDEHVAKLLNFHELRIGMVTRSAIVDKDGRMLVGPGIELTRPLLKRVEHMRERKGLQEPFEVGVPEEL